jgi:hypothetical protein
MDASTTSTTLPQPSCSENRSSRSSSASSRRPNLSLDLSNLPPLSKPAPATNTLLITDLQDLTIFQPNSLPAVREQTISSIAPLNSFSPLPSLRRIVCSFHSEEDALRVREALDGRPLLPGHAVRPKIYFGEPTPVLGEGEDSFRPKLLQAPQHDKLFFISPPPSPPHGWVMRTEEPPNKEVHAGDLTQALTDLKTEQEVGSAAAFAADKIDPDTPVSMTSDNRTGSWPMTTASGQRSRSSTLVYHPEDHGTSPNLPAVLVEDTSAACDVDSDVEMSPIDIQGPAKKLPPKTAMPPVELMR